jgi:hypothetical protein
METQREILKNSKSKKEKEIELLKFPEEKKRIVSPQFLSGGKSHSYCSKCKKNTGTKTVRKQYYGCGPSIDLCICLSCKSYK